MVLGRCTSILLDRLTVRLVRDWRGARGARDEAHVDRGELPAAGVAGQDEGCADGFGDGMTLIAAAGVVARGDDGGTASGAGSHLAEAECLVGQVAVAV